MTNSIEDVKPAPIIDPGYSNQDIHSQSIRDIAAGVEPEKDQPIEKPVESTKPVEEVSLEELGKKIAQDASQETAQKILADQQAKAVEGEKQRVIDEEKNKPKLTPEQEQQKLVDDFYSKEGRNPTWAELAVKLEERAFNKYKEYQEQTKQEEVRNQQAQEEEKAKLARDQEEVRQRGLKIMENDYEHLYNAGKLTPIKDVNDPLDPGVVERKSLEEQWVKVNENRRAQGKDPILSAVTIYDFYYKKPSIQPPGGQAPIAGNKGSVSTPGQEQEYSYTDLKKPWSYFRGR